jgi:FMN-dependent NADH-azoreductase
MTRAKTMKLLHIDSSITGTNSASRQLSAAVVEALKAAIPDLEVIRRDLDADPIPHLDSKRLPTVRPANAPAGAIGIAEEGGDDVLDEFLSADILVIGAPMYNFGNPSRPSASLTDEILA